MSPRGLSTHRLLGLSICVACSLGLAMAAQGAESKSDVEGQALSKVDSALQERSEALEARVKARWQALMQGRIEDAYALELPSYRALYDLARFSETAPSGDLKPTEARVRDIQIEGTRASVMLEVTTLVTLPPPTGRRPMVSSQREIWLERNGTWWHAPTFVAATKPRVPTEMDAGDDAVQAESRDG